MPPPLPPLVEPVKGHDEVAALVAELDQEEGERPAPLRRALQGVHLLQVDVLEGEAPPLGALGVEGDRPPSQDKHGALEIDIALVGPALDPSAGAAVLDGDPGGGLPDVGHARLQVGLVLVLDELLEGLAELLRRGAHAIPPRPALRCAGPGQPRTACFSNAPASFAIAAHASTEP
ncbi:hypothetical protein D3C86_1481530 [compost metagenome]